MKQSLQLKVSQNLTLTPQLQQSIRLLQLSTLELQQEIQQALAENPLLELEEPPTPWRTAELRMPPTTTVVAAEIMLRVSQPSAAKTATAAMELAATAAPA